MNSTKLRWELLVGAFLVNLRLLGDKRRDMRSKHSAACKHSYCKHSLCSSQVISFSPPILLGSCQGHRSHAYSKWRPEEVLCSCLWDSGGPHGFTSSRRPDSTFPRYYSITGQLGLEGTLGGHLVYVLQGKKGKSQQYTNRHLNRLLTSSGWSRCHPKAALQTPDNWCLLKGKSKWQKSLRWHCVSLILEIFGFWLLKQPWGFDLMDRCWWVNAWSQLWISD